MNDRDDLQYREFFADFAAVVEATLVDEGINAEVARAVSGRVIDAVCAQWGGRRSYIPRNKYTIESMRRVIRAQWQGQNTHALCRRLGISESRLRQLHAEARRESEAES